MSDLPNSLALTEIADGANIDAAPHRNNYTAIQAAVNALRAALAGGTAGQRLVATDSDTVGWVTVPACRVYNSANIAVANTTDTALTFDTERYDTDTIHSTSANTSRLTASTAGVYAITGHVSFAANSTGRRIVNIRLNGSTFIATQYVTATTLGDNHAISVSTQYKLAATDYVELVVNQTSGGALNVLASGNYSPEFAMTKIAEG